MQNDRSDSFLIAAWLGFATIWVDVNVSARFIHAKSDLYQMSGIAVNCLHKSCICVPQSILRFESLKKRSRRIESGDVAQTLVAAQQQLARIASNVRPQRMAQHME